MTANPSTPPRAEAPRADADALEDPVHFRVLNEIAIINQLGTTLFERVMPEGMSLAQFALLNRFVRLGGSPTPAELADAFQVTRATMTSTLQKLAAKGLIAVTPDARDGRAKRVAITEEGRAMRTRCLRAVEPELARIADAWPTERAAAMLPSLAALRSLLDASRR